MKPFVQHQIEDNMVLMDGGQVNNHKPIIFSLILLKN